MANWVFKGLKTGVVTTKYPFLKEDIPGSATGTPVIKKDECLPGCSKCLEVCPAGAVSKTLPWPHVPKINYSRCIFCGRCVGVCSGEVICWGKDFELAVARDNHTNFISGVKNGKKTRHMFSRSLHIRHVDAGSCEACLSEINALGSPFYDLHRLGLFFVSSPRHADVLLVSGLVTLNMEEALMKTYQAMPEPKIVIAAGACAAGGWMAGQNYTCSKKLDALLPVDVLIPGCPPGPLTLLHGLLLAGGRASDIRHLTTDI